MLFAAGVVCALPGLAIAEEDLTRDEAKQKLDQTERNLLTECGRFMLRNDEAQAVIDEMRGLIEARWRDIFLASGVSAADCERLKRAFSPASFRGLPED